MGHYDCVTILLRNGANLELVDDKGQTAVFIASHDLKTHDQLIALTVSVITYKLTFTDPKTLTNGLNRVLRLYT